MNIRNFVSKDHIESPFEIIKTQGVAIQAYMLENEQLQKELKSVYDKLTNKDKEIERLNNIIQKARKELKGWEKLDLDNLLVVIRNIEKILEDKLKELKGSDK